MLMKVIQATVIVLMIVFVDYRVLESTYSELGWVYLAICIVLQLIYIPMVISRIWKEE